MEVDCGQLIVRNMGKVQAVYRIGKVLGYGSFGEIREVEHRESQDQFVVKMMTKRLMTAAVQKRVQYEIEIQKKMNHPNIAKIIEWFENSQRFYIVQELLAGGELLTRINKQRHRGFTEQEVATVIHQLLMAINYMHRNHVVHRDVKPENIIFQNEKDLKVKLVDFGCAQKYKQGHMMMQQYGAPYYMAPEMIKGCYNEKVD